MSAMLSFLPMLIERSEMLKIAIRRILEEEKSALPTSEPKAHETTIRVIILDDQEWHSGATAPHIADFRRHAGKAGGP